MSNYRITGWYTDSLNEESFVMFSAETDKEAWQHELPPRFLSHKIERFDGEGWDELKLGAEDFREALDSVMVGILPKP